MLAKSWVKMKKFHAEGDLYHLADTIVKGEMLRPSSLMHKLIKEDERQVYANFLHILGFSPPAMLQSCIHRTLPDDLSVTGSLTADLAVAMTDEGRAGIYAIYIVLPDGTSPTAAHYASIVDDLLRYAKPNPTPDDNAWAGQVDCKIRLKTWPARKTLQGRRYFDAGRVNQNDRGRKVTLRFAHDLRERCLAAPHQNTPLCPPIGHVGWSKATAGRLKAHVGHHSSTYLLSLVHVLLLMRYPGVRQAQTVLQLIPRPSEAAMAEVVYTQLLGTYAEGDMGFNHTAAGYSCSSAITLMDESDWIGQRGLARKYAPDASSTLRKAQKVVDDIADERRRKWQEEDKQRKRKLEALEGELVDLMALERDQDELLALLAPGLTNDLTTES